MSQTGVATGHELLMELSNLADDKARLELLLRSPELHTTEAVERIHAEVVNLARVDLPRATRLAEAASWIADQNGDDYARALAERARGHVLHINGQHAVAVAHYETALSIFERLGRELDAARTVNGALQAVIYLGKYDRAMDWACRARKIFEKYGDRLRIARVDINVANLLYRQDRFSDALALYEHAYAELLVCGEPQDVAVALRNLAVCYISLNQFDQALETYRQAREYCAEHGLSRLVAEADYNVAYLYYLRGEYTEAIRRYDDTRIVCKELGDAYHSALCDLDQSEMYLELNLSEAGADLAQRAHSGFTQLGMTYEAAKALSFVAIAESQQGKSARALKLFDRSRLLFVREQNQVWPALIDLYKAVVLFRDGVYAEARELCRHSLASFLRIGLLSKGALCDLLLARLELKSGDPEMAAQHCATAFDTIQGLAAPALEYQAWFVFGQVNEARGDSLGAYHAFERAHRKLENLRSNLQGEEIKIAFLKDKVEVYESLVSLALAGGSTEARRELAFDYVERAKSRSLADLIAFRAQTLEPKKEALSSSAGDLRARREQLNALYHQIRAAELKRAEGEDDRVSRLREQAREHELHLARTFGELCLADPEYSGLQTGGTLALTEIQAALPQDAALLEYYVARGVIYAWVAGRDSLDVFELGPAEPVQERFRLLQFQLSKFRLGPDYARTFSGPLLGATQAHLQAMHNALIAPLRPRVSARHLIIVPHSFLHYMPFHALWDGQQYLVDQFTVSYAPSASIFALCAAKHDGGEQGALVLGIPDPTVPHITREVSSVAAALGNACLLVGHEADEHALRRYAPTSRFVHIATHGLFRQDNPMFSSIRLGKSELSLFDLYQLRLSCELVTLSGCGTGLNVVVGGDELLGLVRGLLYAGARSALVTLWDVSDESTAAFMGSFYPRLAGSADKAVAAQEAMQEVRRTYPHPYHWAPFVLIGKFW